MMQNLWPQSWKLVEKHNHHNSLCRKSNNYSKDLFLSCFQFYINQVYPNIKRETFSSLFSVLMWLWCWSSHGVIYTQTFNVYVLDFFAFIVCPVQNWTIILCFLSFPYFSLYLIHSHYLFAKHFPLPTVEFSVRIFIQFFTFLYT